MSRVLLYKSGDLCRETAWSPFCVDKKEMRYIVRCGIGILFLSSLQAIRAQSRFDSIQHVEELVVTSRYNHKEVIPSQSLNGAQLARMSTHTVPDAARLHSDPQLKHYGGVGGTPTANIHYTGTNQLGIASDGLEQ